MRGGLLASETAAVKGGAKKTEAGAFAAKEAIIAYANEILMIPALIAFTVAVANRKGQNKVRDIAHLFVTVYHDAFQPDRAMSRSLGWFFDGYFIGVIRALQSLFPSAGKGEDANINSTFDEELRKVLKSAKLTDENWEKVRVRLLDIDEAKDLPTLLDYDKT